jgi:hypothetical protein
MWVNPKDLWSSKVEKKTKFEETYFHMKLTFWVFQSSRKHEKHQPKAEWVGPAQRFTKFT